MSRFKKLYLLVLFLCMLPVCSSSQSLLTQNTSEITHKKDEASIETYYTDSFEDFTTRIHDEHIHTLIIHRADSELEDPVIQLNGDQKITLQFDDLGEDPPNMYYRFEHCSSDWKSSGLQRMDYQTGYNTALISDYDFSFNTIQSYTHYSIEFPNEDIQFTKSGNYVIQVFMDDQTDKPILTARFMIVEPLSNISATIKPSSVVADRDYRQEVDITVNLGAVPSLNPYSEISLVVLQDNRWDNAKTGVKPSFVKGKELIYDYQRELTFDGINEFRHFDAKSVKYRSEEVSSVDLEKDGYRITLSPDLSRAFKKYSFTDDLNGRFLIKNDDMSDAQLESDYIIVHFEMPVDALLGNGDMYLFGQLSNWELSKPYQMTYNPERATYEKDLKLKQGYYNYLYIWQYKNSSTGTTDLTEGNHSETENEYTILIYYKDRSTFSDRLVGYKVVNSLNK